MKISSNGAFKQGLNSIISEEKNPEMMGMNYDVLAGKKNDEYTTNLDKEVVFVLLFGKIIFEWNDEKVEVERESCFHNNPIVLNVPRNTAVKITVLSDTAEVGIASTDNENNFEAMLFGNEDLLCANEERGAGTLNECSTRLVRTFFDRSNRPMTNFFLGEVVSFPGKWSSYPPHTHIEPEIYFYKFLPENGYGFAENGDDVYKVTHNDLTTMPRNVRHSQATAPGYAEYYLWIIRLRDDQAMVTTVVPEHEWTADPDAKFFPNI
ncbi:5-deoxy-glucuronate isomerase [Enterococcus sp. AZ109]|uniref:5-deoxy-glucuronate isomerase n=1 Tax=Enterococcus sp. AZ109 TaxID=2774634 RepID=UPI003F239418